MTDSLPRRLFRSAWLLSQAGAAVRFPYRTPEQIQAEQDRQARRIVAHAYATVPFYRRVMDERGLQPADFHGAGDLSKLPIITKDKTLQKLPSIKTIW